MRLFLAFLFFLFCTLAGACVSRSPEPLSVPPPAPEPEPLPAVHFPYVRVWTARADVPLRRDAGSVAIPRPFTRLEVLLPDTVALRVRCELCPEPVEGWIGREDVVWEAPEPSAAADGSLAEFALAVRTAAADRDVQALRPVMSRRFIHSFGGGEGVLEALLEWDRERYRSLDLLPGLMDGGLATRDGRIWVAPAEFVTDPGYMGLRAGFQRVGGQWEWLFLVGGY